MDGVDESAFCLPHFVYESKDESGNRIKMSLIGLFQHHIKNRLNLFTMTDEHECRPKHIIERMYHFLNKVVSVGEVPRTLFGHLDNCGMAKN